MLEFLFGWVLGVWMGQQLPLPSVQTQIEHWWQSRNVPVEDSPTSEEDIAPVFTGEMPSSA